MTQEHEAGARELVDLGLEDSAEALAARRSSPTTRLRTFFTRSKSAELIHVGDGNAAGVARAQGTQPAAAQQRRSDLGPRRAGAGSSAPQSAAAAASASEEDSDDEDAAMLAEVNAAALDEGGSLKSCAALEVRAQRRIKASMAPEYYKVLGVAPGATPEELKAAHRALMRMWHPDKVRPPVSADESKAMCASINKAYDVLRDPWTRTQYTYFGHEQFHVHQRVIKLFAAFISHKGLSVAFVDPVRGKVGKVPVHLDRTAGRLLVGDRLSVRLAEVAEIRCGLSTAVTQRHCKAKEANLLVSVIMVDEFSLDFKFETVNGAHYFAKRLTLLCIEEQKNAAWLGHYFSTKSRREKQRLRLGKVAKREALKKAPSLREALVEAATKPKQRIRTRSKSFGEAVPENESCELQSVSSIASGARPSSDV